MKISAILCLTLLQTCLVQSRTIENVIEDLNHIFMDLWGQYVSDRMELVRHGKINTADYGRFGISVAYNSKLQVEQIPEVTRNEIKQIVEDTGMTWLEGLIKHCYTKEEMDLRDLLKAAESGFYVCSNLDIINHEYLWHMTALPEDIRLETWDKITSECRNVSSTPEEMQYCLIDTLYFTLAPIVDERHKETNARIEEMGTVVERKKYEIQQCYQIVTNKTVEDQTSLTTEFRQCCVEASHNK